MSETRIERYAEGESIADLLARMDDEGYRLLRLLGDRSFEFVPKPTEAPEPWPDRWSVLAQATVDDLPPEPPNKIGKYRVTVTGSVRENGYKLPTQEYDLYASTQDAAAWQCIDSYVKQHGPDGLQWNARPMTDDQMRELGWHDSQKKKWQAAP